MGASTKLLIAAVVFVAIVGIVIVVFLSSPVTGQYDEFAQCLSQKGAKMYGAFWCSHCKAQKELFGASWRFVSYVECSTPDGGSQLPVCSAAGIEGYPTWVFADGSKESGELTLQQLAARANCSLG